MNVHDAIMSAMGAAAVLWAGTKPDVHSRIRRTSCNFKQTSGSLPAVPPDAHWNKEWQATGVCDDFWKIEEGKVVFTHGFMRDSVRGTNTWSVFAANLGFRAGGIDGICWWKDANGFLNVEWRGLYERNADWPVRVQGTFAHDGSAVYRYELDALPGNAEYSVGTPFSMREEAITDSTELIFIRDDGDADCDGVPNKKELEDGSDPFSPDLDTLPPPAITNTNAYYRIDVYTPGANALTVFAADRASNLGDVRIATAAGETKSIMLLTGVEYDVVAYGAEGLVLSIAGDAKIERIGDTHFSLAKPLAVEFEQRANGIVTASVSPENIGEKHSWTSTCCRTIQNGCEVELSCDVCDSNEPCVLADKITYEGAQWHFETNLCACKEFHRHGGEPAQEQCEPTLELELSSDAILFGDSYADWHGNVTVLPSTEEVLTCRYHAIRDGVLTLHFTDADNTNKCLRVFVEEGHDIGLQEGTEYSEMAAEGETGRISCRLQATGRCTATNLHIRADLTGQGKTLEKYALLNVAKIYPEAILPSAEGNTRRHTWGITERVELKSSPNLPQTTFETVFPLGDISNGGTGAELLICATNAASGLIAAKYKSAAIGIWGEVCRPAGLVPLNIQVMTNGAPDGVAGDIGMRLDPLAVLPLNAGFYGFQIYEEPSTGSHGGYFDAIVFKNWWDHSTYSGAANWSICSETGIVDTVSIGNCGEFVTGGWSEGFIDWTIPIWWDFPPYNPYSHNRDPNASGTLMDTCQQTFRIDSQGTVSISKFGHTVARTVDSVVTLDGECISNPHPFNNRLETKAGENEEMKTFAPFLLIGTVAAAMPLHEKLQTISAGADETVFADMVKATGGHQALEKESYNDDYSDFNGRMALVDNLASKIRAVKEPSLRRGMIAMYAQLCDRVFEDTIAALPQGMCGIEPNDLCTIERRVLRIGRMSETLLSLLRDEELVADAWHVHFAIMNGWKSVATKYKLLHDKYRRENPQANIDEDYHYAWYGIVAREANRWEWDLARKCSSEYCELWRDYWRLPKPERGKFMERVCNAIGDVPQWYQEILANGEPSPEPDPETPADELERWSYETQKALQTFDIE